jgi:hypothetical protein
MKPERTDKVILRKFFKAYDKTREKLVIPKAAPKAKTPKTTRSNVFTASMT